LINTKIMSKTSNTRKNSSAKRDENRPEKKDRFNRDTMNEDHRHFQKFLGGSRDISVGNEPKGSWFRGYFMDAESGKLRTGRLLAFIAVVVNLIAGVLLAIAIISGASRGKPSSVKISDFKSAKREFESSTGCKTDWIKVLETPSSTKLYVDIRNRTLNCDANGVVSLFHYEDQPGLNAIKRISANDRDEFQAFLETQFGYDPAGNKLTLAEFTKTINGDTTYVAEINGKLRDEKDKILSMLYNTLVGDRAGHGVVYICGNKLNIQRRMTTAIIDTALFVKLMRNDQLSDRDKYFLSQAERINSDSASEFSHNAHFAIINLTLHDSCELVYLDYRHDTVHVGNGKYPKTEKQAYFNAIVNNPQKIHYVYNGKLHSVENECFAEVNPSFKPNIENDNVVSNYQVIKTWGIRSLPYILLTLLLMFDLLSLNFIWHLGRKDRKLPANAIHTVAGEAVQSQPFDTLTLSLYGEQREKLEAFKQSLSESERQQFEEMMNHYGRAKEVYDSFQKVRNLHEAQNAFSILFDFDPIKPDIERMQERITKAADDCRSEISKLQAEKDKYVNGYNVLLKEKTALVNDGKNLERAKKDLEKERDRLKKEVDDLTQQMEEQKVKNDIFEKLYEPTLSCLEEANAAIEKIVNSNTAGIVKNFLLASIATQSVCRILPSWQEKVSDKLNEKTIIDSLQNYMLELIQQRSFKTAIEKVTPPDNFKSELNTNLQRFTKEYNALFGQAPIKVPEIEPAFVKSMEAVAQTTTEMPFINAMWDSFVKDFLTYAESKIQQNDMSWFFTHLLNITYHAADYVIYAKSDNKDLSVRYNLRYLLSGFQDDPAFARVYNEQDILQCSAYSKAITALAREFNARDLKIVVDKFVIKP